MMLEKQISDLVDLYSHMKFAEMVQKATQLSVDYPHVGVIWNLLAAGEKALGNLPAAEVGFRMATKLEPGFADAFYNLGITLHDQGKFAEAITAYEKAVECHPENIWFHFNMGNSLRDAGKLDQAILAYQRAALLNPGFSEAYNGVGTILLRQGKLTEAIAAFERAISIEPRNCTFYNNLGVALCAVHSLDAALIAFDSALEMNPHFFDAINNKAGALISKGESDKALATLRRALDVNPNHHDAYVNLGAVLDESGRLGDAISAYQKALKLNPSAAYVEAQMIHARQKACDFSIYSAISDVKDRLGVETRAVAPFSALSWEDNPERQRKRSEVWAKEKIKPMHMARPTVRSSHSRKLRVGIFSTDFRDHPIMCCIAGILKEYDRATTEVYAYSLLRDASGRWRQTVAALVDTFVDAASLNDQDLVAMALSHELDIAIDLNGYTAHARSRVFQARLAPIQINFLGFPSTLGAECYDYMIADHMVIPESQRPFYLEKFIYMPYSYFPIAHPDLDSVKETSRSDHGLPDGALVFCCFNHSYKISLNEFRIWMRVLSKVEGSVLWLVESNDLAKANLRKEATQFGVDPDRLIFAKKVSLEQHLERQRHADLFVDTFNYNAHTTACNALWCGVPLVTKLGQQFSARVAASLLTAVGLPELIVATEDAYEDMILRLAGNPDELAALKHKLSINRSAYPLFNPVQYTRDFERALHEVFDIHLQGQVPRDVRVEATHLVDVH